MKISNKTTYPVILVISIPLLILGGCASHDTVKIAPEITHELSEINEVIEEQAQANDSVTDISSEQDNIEIIESVEPVVEVPVEENIEIKVATQKPEEGIIGFAFDQSDISAEYGEMLWHHAQYLKENKNLVLNISGHTDSSGERVYNEILSKKRAETVAKILLEFGVEEDRIKVTGNASDQPLAGAVNHREHRRVELDYEDTQIVSN